MSSLNSQEKSKLEKLFVMSSGYVSDFTDSKFGIFVSEAVGIDIHSPKYSINGKSKAKKLRELWHTEPDSIVGRLLTELITYEKARIDNHAFNSSHDSRNLIEQCESIAERLLSVSVNLDHIKKVADVFNASHLAEQILRMNQSVESDPALAIGTAKELIETCCKTILASRGKPVTGTPDIPALTKDTLKELKLVPDVIPDAAKGSDVVKRLLQNLGTIGHGLAELRNLYGTGHGKHGASKGLSARHAKLACGAAATLAVFLFETHEETLKNKP